MTPSPEAGARQKPGLKDISLDTISLWDCNIERGETPDMSFGKVDSTIGFEAESTDTGLMFLASTEHSFYNASDELLANIKARYRLSYEVENADLLEEADVARFSSSVAMQVIPFHREFMVSMSNRLGFPTFVFPLVRQSQIKMTVTESDLTKDSAG